MDNVFEGWTRLPKKTGKKNYVVAYKDENRVRKMHFINLTLARIEAIRHFQMGNLVSFTNGKGISISL